MTVVTAVSEAWSLNETATATGLSPQATKSLVAKLGPWLTHVHGAATTKVCPIAWRPDVEVEAARGDPDTVLIGEGFERQRGSRQDLTRSLAAIAVWCPDEAEVRRFCTSKGSGRSSVLTMNYVSTLWYFAHLGRLADLDLTDSVDWARQVVAAWDLLEGPATRLFKAITRVQGNCLEQPQRTLSKALAAFSNEVADDPEGLPRTAEDLALGQVRRIAERADVAPTPT